MIFVILDVPKKVGIGRVKVVENSIEFLEGDTRFLRALVKEVNLRKTAIQVVNDKVEYVDLENLGQGEKFKLLVERPILVKGVVAIGVKEWL